MKNLNRCGFYSSVSMTVLTLIAFGIVILMPPLSGPYCKAVGCYDVIFNLGPGFFWLLFLFKIFLVFIFDKIMVKYM